MVAHTSFDASPLGFTAYLAQLRQSPPPVEAVDASAIGAYFKLDPSRVAAWRQELLEAAAAAADVVQVDSKAQREAGAGGAMPLGTPACEGIGGPRAAFFGGGAPAASGPPMQGIPDTVRHDYERTLAKLPLEGALRRRPWASSYLPDHKGGLAWRPQARGDFRHYRRYTIAQLQAMPEAQREKALRGLSPAEKMSLLRGEDIGDDRAVLLDFEKSRCRPDAPVDQGLCHGVAMAALLLPEPRPLTVDTLAGLDVPFGSHDFKAIASYYFSMVNGGLYDFGQTPPPVLQLGVRRELHTGDASENLQVNPGAFHAMLAKVVQRRGRGLVIDVDQGPAVWNSPVYKYQSRIAEPGGSRPYDAVEQQRDAREGVARAPETRALATVTTEVWVVPLTSQPSWAPTPAPEERVAYRYELELDAEGRICGGRWLSAERPDIAWTPLGSFDFELVGGFFDEFFYHYQQAARR